MNRDRTIAQHRLGPRRGNRDIVAHLAQRHVPVGILLDILIGLAARQRVLEVPHVTRHLDVLDFQIGNRGFEMRVPVHQPLAAIDQALAVHVHEDLDDGVVEVALFAFRRIGRARHGEGLARPVAGGAEAFQLPDDRPARGDLLLPDAGGEGVAAHLGARRLALGRHVTFGHHLGGDAGMVGAGLPQRVEAAHPVPADQDVLQRVVEGMPHVERPRDVRRRDHDAIAVGPRLRVGARPEASCLFPGAGDAGLGLGGVEGLVHDRLARLLGCRRLI